MTAPLKQGDPIIVNVALGDRAYDIVIGRGVLATLGTRVAALKPGAKAAIVTDETVGALYLAATKKSLADAGIESTDIVVPPGESSKSFSVLEKVCDGLIGARKIPSPSKYRAQPLRHAAGGRKIPPPPRKHDRTCDRD